MEHTFIKLSKKQKDKVLLTYLDELLKQGIFTIDEVNEIKNLISNKKPPNQSVGLLF